jgi:cell division protein FtsB
MAQKGKEREILLSKLEKAIKDKEYELEKLVGSNRRLEDEVKHLSDKLNIQEKGY